MPLTISRKMLQKKNLLKGPLTDEFAYGANFTTRPFVFGIDGCKDGWVVASLPATGPLCADMAILPDFANILAFEASVNLRAEAIMIDVPIGLPDYGRRACDTMARKRLGKRASSVFSVPRRPMLAHSSYEEANQWGKEQGSDGRDNYGDNSAGGLSKQAWHILPKIREIDSVISPILQQRVTESHPELSFMRLNNDISCQYPKKTTDGQNERAQILSLNGIKNTSDLIDHIREGRKSRVAIDDIYDALALALTARAKLTGKALTLSDGMYDTRGLRMEIWG